MANDEDDAAGDDPVADLAELKPAVERLRSLLQAAATAEEAAASVDASVTGDRPESGGPLEEAAEGPSPGEVEPSWVGRRVADD